MKLNSLSRGVRLCTCAVWVPARTLIPMENLVCLQRNETETKKNYLRQSHKNKIFYRFDYPFTHEFWGLRRLFITLVRALRISHRRSERTLSWLLTLGERARAQVNYNIYFSISYYDIARDYLLFRMEWHLGRWCRTHKVLVASIKCHFQFIHINRNQIIVITVLTSLAYYYVNRWGAKLSVTNNFSR